MSLLDGSTVLCEDVLASAVTAYVPEVVLTPSTDPYGRDLAGVSDIDELFIEVEGDDAMVQALARRLITPRGTLIDDDDYGMDLRSYLSRKLTEPELAALPSSVANELRKDDAVIDVTCELVVYEAGERIELDIQVDRGTDTLAFTFALTPSKVSVIIGDT